MGKLNCHKPPTIRNTLLGMGQLSPTALAGHLEAIDLAGHLEISPQVPLLESLKHFPLHSIEL
jgi:hypothetical protein